MDEVAEESILNGAPSDTDDSNNNQNKIICFIRTTKNNAK